MKRSISLRCLLLLAIIGSAVPLVEASGILKIMVVLPEFHLEAKDSGRIFPDGQHSDVGRNSRQRVPDPAGETEIIKAFITAGFQVVDQEQISKIRYSEQVIAAINGENDLATLIGQQFNADIMITGEAIVQSTGSSFQGLFSSRARVEAKAIDLKSGKLIFTEGLYASGLDRSEKISEKKALQKAGEEIGNLFVEKLRNFAVSPASKLQVIVTGLSYGDFVLYKNNVLSSINGVKDVKQESFVKQHGFLLVETDQNPDVLANRIVMNKSKNFASEIIEMSHGKITIAVRVIK
jgi:hypothetical protein